MRVHWLQHVPFEGLGRIEPWLRSRGHALTRTALHAGDALPAGADSLDWLIVMGGPMNVYQHRDHPWLVPEKRLIAETVASGRRVLGVCLGAQLIADALGGKVCQNPEREIGWFPVHAAPDGAASPFAFPPEVRAFHWHGDTFSLPPASTWLARSAGCDHQAFAVGSRVLGLQCHLEMTRADIDRVAGACAEELTTGRFVRAPGQLATGADEGSAGELLDRFLSILEAD